MPVFMDLRKGWSSKKPICLGRMFVYCQESNQRIGITQRACQGTCNVLPCDIRSSGLVKHSTCENNWKPYFLYESLNVPTKTEINEFSEMIGKKSAELECSHMEAIIYHCEQTGMEIDVASSLISSALKAKIREEAQDLNLLKKSSKLPL